MSQYDTILVEILKKLDSTPFNKVSAGRSFGEPHTKDEIIKNINKISKRYGYDDLEDIYFGCLFRESCNKDFKIHLAPEEDSTPICYKVRWRYNENCSFVETYIYIVDCVGNQGDVSYFILYPDNEKFRVYIPEKGNTYNRVSLSQFNHEQNTEAKLYKYVVNKINQITDGSFDFDYTETFIDMCGLYMLGVKDIFNTKVEHYNFKNVLNNNPHIMDGDNEKMINEFLERVGLNCMSNSTEDVIVTKE